MPDNERLVQLLSKCCTLLSSLIDPGLRAIQVKALETPQTIEKLEAMRNECRELDTALDGSEDPYSPPPPRESLN